VPAEISGVLGRFVAGHQRFGADEEEGRTYDVLS
jgi:hypothetical protein